MMSPAHYLFLSLALFLIGCVGVVTRRNVIVVLMSIELILNAVNINLVLFSRIFGDAAGQVFALFIIADAAAEAGAHKLVGKIFTSNEASIAMVGGLGWREVGVHERHGKLDGEWKDVLVVERLL